MREILNQFIDNLNGQFVEVSSKEALYQCMDLAYAWVFVLRLPKATIQNQYAYQVYTNPKDITKQYFDLILNETETIPHEGDLVIWSNKLGVAGHIAIVVEATQSKMLVFEQNNPLGTNAHVQERNYTNVLGFLRPKGIQSGGDGVIEKLPKDNVIRDIRTFLNGTYNEDEIKADIASGKNLVELGEGICNGDTKFFNKWILPQLNRVQKTFDERLKLEKEACDIKVKEAIINAKIEVQSQYQDYAQVKDSVEYKLALFLFKLLHLNKGGEK